MREEFWKWTLIGTLIIFIVRFIVVKDKKWYMELMHICFALYLIKLIDVLILPIQLTDVGFKNLEFNWIPFWYLHNHWNNIRSIYVGQPIEQYFEMFKLIVSYMWLLMPMGFYFTMRTRRLGHMVNFFMGILFTIVIIGLQWLLNAYGLIATQYFEIDHMILQIIGYFVGAIPAMFIKSAKKSNKLNDTVYYKVNMKKSS